MVLIIRSLGLLFYFFLALAGLLGLAGFGLAFHFWLFLHSPSSADREPHHVIVKQGMNANRISQLLENEGLIVGDREFRLLCWLERCGQKLRSGEYVLYSLQTPPQILEKLMLGKGIIHRVTFPEGSSARDVAKLLAQSGLASEERVLELSRDGEEAKSLGLRVPDLEGYLFPDTYYFEKTQDEGAMLKEMVHQSLRHFTTPMHERASELGMSVHEVLILASLVEKEAKVDEERPLIAAVFANRLKLNMPLQSDPTAVYDLPGFSGTVTRQHLERDSPYNTYKIHGLPKGPICNPGDKSVQAVLYPRDVPYLYFVSNNDGTHQFSTTLEEHERAVERYREKREAEKSGGQGGQGQGSQGQAGQGKGNQDNPGAQSKAQSGATPAPQPAKKP